MVERRARWLDQVGAYASAVCAVHCVLTGLALGLLSALGLGFLGSAQAELTFLAVTVTVGVVALVHGRRKHHSVWPATLFVLGLACWLISHFGFGHGHGASRPSSPPMLGTAFAVLGGTFLIGFHVLNQRLQHRCGCDHCARGG